MRCTISHMPAIVIAIPLLAMGLDVHAQQQVPGETYTADLKGTWTCDSYAERQARRVRCADHFVFIVAHRSGNYGMVHGAEPTSHLPRRGRNISAQGNALGTMMRQES